ncbi:s (chs5p-arf1p-binding proteins) protein, partial [Cystoisospora suis]
EFEGLGPPDLCCLEKVLQKDVSVVAKVLESVALDEPFQQHSSSSSSLSTPAVPLNNESALFCHYVVGLDASQPAAIAAYIYGLVAKQETETSWFGRSKWHIIRGLYCTFDVFHQVDVRVEVRFPSSPWGKGGGGLTLKGQSDVSQFSSSGSVVFYAVSTPSSNLYCIKTSPFPSSSSSSALAAPASICPSTSEPATLSGDSTGVLSQPHRHPSRPSPPPSSSSSPSSRFGSSSFSLRALRPTSPYLSIVEDVPPDTWEATQVSSMMRSDYPPILYGGLSPSCMRVFSPFNSIETSPIPKTCRDFLQLAACFFHAGDSLGLLPSIGHGTNALCEILSNRILSMYHTSLEETVEAFSPFSSLSPLMNLHLARAYSRRKDHFRALSCLISSIRCFPEEACFLQMQSKILLDIASSPPPGGPSNKPLESTFSPSLFSKPNVDPYFQERKPVESLSSLPSSSASSVSDSSSPSNFLVNHSVSRSTSFTRMSPVGDHEGCSGWKGREERLERKDTFSGVRRRRKGCSSRLILRLPKNLPSLTSHHTVHTSSSPSSGSCSSSQTFIMRAARASQYAVSLSPTIFPFWITLARSSVLCGNYGQAFLILNACPHVPLSYPFYTKGLSPDIHHMSVTEPVQRRTGFYSYLWLRPYREDFLLLPLSKDQSYWSDLRGKSKQGSRNPSNFSSTWSPSSSCSPSSPSLRDVRFLWEWMKEEDRQEEGRRRGEQGHQESREVEETRDEPEQRRERRRDSSGRRSGDSSVEDGRRDEIRDQVEGHKRQQQLRTYTPSTLTLDIKAIQHGKEDDVKEKRDSLLFVPQNNRRELHSLSTSSSLLSSPTLTFSSSSSHSAVSPQQGSPVYGRTVLQHSGDDGVLEERNKRLNEKRREQEEARTSGGMEEGSSSHHKNKPEEVRRNVSYSWSIFRGATREFTSERPVSSSLSPPASGIVIPTAANASFAHSSPPSSSSSLSSSSREVDHEERRNEKKGYRRRHSEESERKAVDSDESLTHGATSTNSSVENEGGGKGSPGNNLASRCTYTAAHTSLSSLSLASCPPPTQPSTVPEMGKQRHFSSPPLSLLQTQGGTLSSLFSSAIGSPVTFAGASPPDGSYSLHSSPVDVSLERGGKASESLSSSSSSFFPGSPVKTLQSPQRTTTKRLPSLSLETLNLYLNAVKSSPALRFDYFENKAYKVLVQMENHSSLGLLLVLYARIFLPPSQHREFLPPHLLRWTLGSSSSSSSILSFSLLPTQGPFHDGRYPSSSLEMVDREADRHLLPGDVTIPEEERVLQEHFCQIEIESVHTGRRGHDMTEIEEEEALQRPHGEEEQKSCPLSRGYTTQACQDHEEHHRSFPYVSTGTTHSLQQAHSKADTDRSVEVCAKEAGGQNFQSKENGLKESKRSVHEDGRVGSSTAIVVEKKGLGEGSKNPVEKKSYEIEHIESPILLSPQCEEQPSSALSSKLCSDCISVASSYSQEKSTTERDLNFMSNSSTISSRPYSTGGCAKKLVDREGGVEKHSAGSAEVADDGEDRGQGPSRCLSQGSHKKDEKSVTQEKERGRSTSISSSGRSSTKREKREITDEEKRKEEIRAWLDQQAPFYHSPSSDCRRARGKMLEKLIKVLKNDIELHAEISEACSVHTLTRLVDEVSNTTADGKKDPSFEDCQRVGEFLVAWGSLCCRLGDCRNMLSAYGLALRLGLSCKASFELMRWFARREDFTSVLRIASVTCFHLEFICGETLRSLPDWMASCLSRLLDRIGIATVSNSDILKAVSRASSSFSPSSLSLHHALGYFLQSRVKGVSATT